MQAVVWRGPGRIALEEAPVPVPGPGEVLVRTRAVGICGTDLEIYDGRFPQSVPPMILGHEGAGVVEALGPGVRSLRRGTRVSVSCVLSCGACEYCRRGRPGLCDEGRVLGVSGAPGEYAEFFVAPQENCYRLPQSISWEQAALIDTLAGPVHALGTVTVPEGGSVAVFGPGPAGLFFCALARLRGAGRVFLVGTRANRLAYGKQYGAELLIDASREQADQVIRAATEGRGVDLVIEAAGSAVALRQAVACLKKGGTLLLYGVFGEGAVPVDVQTIQLTELVVRGAADSLYPPAIDLVRRKAIDVASLITHRLTLAELPEAFSRGLIKNKLEGYAQYMKGIVLP